MKRLLWAAVTASIAFVPGIALAQDGDVEGPGHQVGAGSYAFPYVGSEAGVISNVFFEDAETEATGIFRLVAGISLRSEPGESTNDESAADAGAGSLRYRLGLRLRYDEYLSSSEAVQAQRDLAIDASAGVDIWADRPISFFAVDNFTRDTRPPNFESPGNIARDVNRLRLGIRWKPPGRTLSGSFEYRNTIDRFEGTELEFANRIQHEARLRVDWRFLPITRFYFQASQGVYSSLGDGLLNGQPYKVDSFPLDVRVGVDSAITEMTTLSLHAGWAVGFYDSEITYNSPIYGAKFGYRYSPLGRVSLRFERRFGDSINSNFYGDFLGAIRVDQQVGRIEVMGEAGYIFRQYDGVPVVISDESSRSDGVMTAEAEARYRFKDSLLMSATYQLRSVSTDFRYFPPDTVVPDDPGYVRHEFVVGVRAAF